MEFIIIAMILIIFIAVLRYIFGYSMKKLKNIGKDEELDEISKKYPENKEMCKWYLKKLNNTQVEIEESNDAQASLYIWATNKILIANIKNTYTRIQTIAHECLHSIQDKKLLMFNFIFSNIYLLYFIIVCILGILKMLPYKMMFLVILLIFSAVYYLVRIFLENDAMIKARFLAKDYMEKQNISSKEEIEKIVNGFDKLNDIGIKCVNYNLFFNTIIKIIIFLVIILFI